MRRSFVEPRTSQRGCVNWRQLLFSVIGKDPDAVVVSFASGNADLCRKMAIQVRDLEPHRRHFLVCLDQSFDVPGVTSLVVSSLDPFLETRHALRSFRIGLAPVLFDSAPHPLRSVAACLAPRKILAFNQRLERHHMRASTPIASFLLLKGVELDRIWLRPWSKGDGYAASKYVTLDGRPWRLGRRRIGILSPYFPWPLSHGGAVRIYHLLREAAKEFDIVLYSFGAVEQDSPIMDLVARAYLFELPRYRKPRWASLLPPEVCEYNSSVLQQLLETSCRELKIELLQVEYTQLAQYSGDVLVEHDVTFDLYDQVAARGPSLISRWNAWRWRRFEHKAVKKFSRVVTMAHRDANLLGTPNARVIPNGVDLSRFVPTAEAAGFNVLFIGSFRHFPNILAFRFFHEQVWPLVQQRFPQATFTAVAGPDPEQHWCSYTADPFPAVLGFVPDVVPLYQQTNLVVAPTLVSAGTNLKVLEAMAMGRAVVATSSGCQGLGLQHGHSVWIADTAGAFADGICSLFLNPDLRATIARNARQVALSEFDWQEIGTKQQTLWEEIIGPSFNIRPGTEADIEAVQAIQQQAPESANWPPLSYLNQCFWIIESLVPKTEVAGFAVWREVDTGEWELLNLAVSPNVRRRGVASRLIAKLKELKADTIFLEVRESNTAARSLYGHHHFLEVGQRKNYYAHPTENAIVLRFQK